MISIVITTYKRPVNILKKAIESIINQTYSEWELVIVNDFPEDIELCQQIGDLINSFQIEKIKYIIHNSNKGACVARNTGIENTVGKYIAFLDDDDQWCRDKIEKMLPFFDTQSVGMVFSDIQYVYNRYVKIHKSVPHSKLEDNCFSNLLVSNFIGSTSNPIMTRIALQKVGGFNPDMRACQDYEVWLKISKEFDVNYCPRPLLKYYFSDECITKNIEARIEGHEKLIEKYTEQYNSNLNLLHLKYLHVACDCLLTKDYDYFKLYFIKSLKCSEKKIGNYTILIKTLLVVLRNELKKLK